MTVYEHDLLGVLVGSIGGEGFGTRVGWVCEEQGRYTILTVCCVFARLSVNGNDGLERFE